MSTEYNTGKCIKNPAKLSNNKEPDNLKTVSTEIDSKYEEGKICKMQVFLTLQPQNIRSMHCDSFIIVRFVEIPHRSHKGNLQ